MTTETITFKNIQNHFGDRWYGNLEERHLKAWAIDEKFIYWIPNNKQIKKDDLDDELSYLMSDETILKGRAVYNRIRYNPDYSEIKMHRLEPCSTTIMWCARNSDVIEIQDEIPFYGKVTKSFDIIKYVMNNGCYYPKYHISHGIIK